MKIENLNKKPELADSRAGKIIVVIIFVVLVLLFGISWGCSDSNPVSSNKSTSQDTLTLILPWMNQTIYQTPSHDSILFRWHYTGPANSYQVQYCQDSTFPGAGYGFLPNTSADSIYGYNIATNLPQQEWYWRLKVDDNIKSEIGKFKIILR